MRLRVVKDKANLEQGKKNKQKMKNREKITEECAGKLKEKRRNIGKRS